MRTHVKPNAFIPPTADEAPTAGRRLERKRSVLARTGMSNTTLWRRAGRDFPAPIRIGPNTVAWVSDEVDQWIENQISHHRIRVVARSA